MHTCTPHDGAWAPCCARHHAYAADMAENANPPARFSLRLASKFLHDHAHDTYVTHRFAEEG